MAKPSLPTCTLVYPTYKCGCAGCPELANTKDCPECKRLERNCNLNEIHPVRNELCPDCQKHADELWEELEEPTEEQPLVGSQHASLPTAKCEICNISHGRPQQTQQQMQQPQCRPRPQHQTTAAVSRARESIVQDSRNLVNNLQRRARRFSRSMGR